VIAVRSDGMITILSALVSVLSFRFRSRASLARRLATSADRLTAATPSPLTGDWSIAASELFRVFELNRSGNGAVERHATADATAALETEIAVADPFRAQLDETRRDRDRWAEAATVALPPPAETRWVWWRSKKVCK
jgi:hypothetical protein